jgi:RNA 2',3'-cyclic 3'-phosphodiesterase
MADEKSIRTFLAIEIPADVLNGISAVQARVKESLQGQIRWVKPEGIHLTLKFFGHVFEKDIAAISRIATDHVSGMKPLALDIGTLGVFPDINRPRVIWLGIGHDVEPLIMLQRSLDEGFYGCGFAKEERPFKPHLTLARIKDHKGLIGLAKIMEKSNNYTAGSFDATKLKLFKSQLKPDGAVYTQLASFPFGG